MHKNNHKASIVRYFKSWCWVPFSVAIGVLSVSILSSDGWGHEWAISAILWFSLSTFGPALIALSIREATKLRRPIAVLCNKPPHICVQPIGMAISGITFLIVALTTQLSVEVFPFIGPARVHAFVVTCTFFLNYGALAYVYANLVALAVRLGNLEVKGKVFSWPRDSITAIEAVYVRLLMVGGLVYLASVGIFRYTPWAVSWGELNRPWVLLWVVPPGLGLISFFGVFSVALHKLLLQCRERAERELNEQLCLSYDAWKDRRDTTAENSISSLLKWRDSIRLEKVWPMNLRASIITVTTLLLPSIEAIAKVAKLGAQLTS